MSSVTGRHAPGASGASVYDHNTTTESMGAGASPLRAGGVPSYAQTHASSASSSSSSSIILHGPVTSLPDAAAARGRRDHKPAEPDGEPAAPAVPIQPDLADYRVRERRLANLADQARRLDDAQGRTLGRGLGQACPEDAWPKLVWSLVEGQQAPWGAEHQPFLEGVFEGWLGRQGRHADGRVGAALDLINTAFRYLTCPVTGRAGPNAGDWTLLGPRAPFFGALANAAFAHAGDGGAQVLLRRFIPYVAADSKQGRGLRLEGRDDRQLGAIAAAELSRAQRSALPRWLVERAQLRGLNGFAWMAGPLLREPSDGKGVAKVLLGMKDLSALDHGAAMLLDAAQDWPSCEDRDVIRALRNCPPERLAPLLSALAETAVHPMVVVRGLLGLREAVAEERGPDDARAPADDAWAEAFEGHPADPLPRVPVDEADEADVSLRDLLDKSIKDVLKRAAAQASPRELIEVGHRYALSQPRPPVRAHRVDAGANCWCCPPPLVPLDHRRAVELVNKLYPQPAKYTGAAMPERKDGSPAGQRTEGQKIQDWLCAGMRMKDLGPSQALAVGGLSRDEQLELVKQGDWARASSPQDVCARIRAVRDLSVVETADTKSTSAAGLVSLDDSEGASPHLTSEVGLALIGTILEQNLKHQDRTVLAAAREAVMAILQRPHPAVASRERGATDRKGDPAKDGPVMAALDRMLLVDRLHPLYTGYLRALGLDEACLARPSLRSWERQGAQQWAADIDAEVAAMRAYKAAHRGDPSADRAAEVGEKMANFAKELRAKLDALPETEARPGGSAAASAAVATTGSDQHAPDAWTLQQVRRLLRTCDLDTLAGVQKAVAGIFKLFEENRGGTPAIAGRELARQCGPGRHEELIWVLKNQENDETLVHSPIGLIVEEAYAQMLEQSRHRDGVTGAAGALADILFRPAGHTDGFINRERYTDHLRGLASAAMAAIPVGEFAHFLDKYFVLPRDAHPTDFRHRADGADFFWTLGGMLMCAGALSEDRRQEIQAWLELQAQRMTPAEFGRLAGSPGMRGAILFENLNVSARQLGTALLRAESYGEPGSQHDSSFFSWRLAIEDLRRDACSEPHDAEGRTCMDPTTSAIALAGLWLHAREGKASCEDIAFLREAADRAIGAVAPYVDPQVLIEAGYLRARAESQRLTPAQADQWIDDVLQHVPDLPEPDDPAAEGEEPQVDWIEAIEAYLRAGLECTDLNPREVLGIGGLSHEQRMDLFTRGDWVRATSPEQVVQRIAEIGKLDAPAGVLAGMIAEVLTMNRPRLNDAVMATVIQQFTTLMARVAVFERPPEGVPTVLASLKLVFALARRCAGVDLVLARQPPQVRSWEVDGVRRFIDEMPGHLEALASSPHTAPLTEALRLQLQGDIRDVTEALRRSGH